MTITPADICQFWFGDIVDDDVTTDKSALWWGGGAVVDNDIKQRFEGLLEQAASGQLKTWEATPQGLMALIILLDQFPLNIYRGAARAYDYESQAIQLCLNGIENKMDTELSLIERIFFYMPLEHSEKIEHQNLAVKMVGQLVASAAPGNRKRMQGFLDFAIEHQDIVQKFSRFPHRNEVLGRKPTAEETAYLSSGGKRYGQ